MPRPICCCQYNHVIMVSVCVMLMTTYYIHLAGVQCWKSLWFHGEYFPRRKNKLLWKESRRVSKDRCHVWQNWACVHTGCGLLTWSPRRATSQVLCTSIHVSDLHIPTCTALACFMLSELVLAAFYEPLYSQNIFLTLQNQHFLLSSSVVRIQRFPRCIELIIS